MVKVNEYQLKFHEDYYQPIREEIKIATTRNKPKPLNIGDFVIATFLPSDKLMLLQIKEHYAMRLKDLTETEAKREGYFHEDLLKHELKTIYPDLTDEDYVYIYKFKRRTESRTALNTFRNEHVLKDNQWVSKCGLVNSIQKPVTRTIN